MTAQDHTQASYDVIVVGSGAGAMVAALFAADQGLSVLMVEKSEQFGGTSALSGGGVWVPNNHHFAALGGTDSPEQALTYMKAAIGEHVDEARLRAYVEQAPAMARELEACSRVRFAVAEKYPDYYPHLPGALAGGRTLDPEIFDTSLLGEELRAMRPAPPTIMLLGRIAWTARQAHKALARERGWQLMLLGLMLRYQLDFRRKGKTDRRAGLGTALIAALRCSLMDRKVPLWLNTEFRDLCVEQGHVRGIVVLREGRELRLSARRGVILASGGFEQNQALRERYLPKPTERRCSITPPENTGSALEAGVAHGAATRLLEHAWFAPTVAVPGEKLPRPLFAERSIPGSIVVNQEGRRFVNEASPYLEFVRAMYADQERTGGRSIPAWVIFDSHFRYHYPMGPLMPGQIMPDRRLPKEWLNTLYFKADTLEALASSIGVDAAGLVASVERMNAYARSGVDEEFGRGGNVFDRYYGDRHVKPNPCLAPLLKKPYYALRIDAGDIGTKGGLLTNEHAQVVRDDLAPIAGLYAIGNCSASVMGPCYPGAGSTLGPAMTFGYVAAKHLAASDERRAAEQPPTQPSPPAG